MKKTQRSYNSTLRRVSKQTAKAKRKTDPERRGYVAEKLFCECCVNVHGRNREATDPHEMARGSHRAEAVKHRCCWLALCRSCHEAMDDYSVWPLDRQLALKLVSDPDHFDLVTFNRVRGRAETAIALADVVKHLRVA